MKILLLAWVPFALIYLFANPGSEVHARVTDKEAGESLLFLLSFGWAILLTTVYVITRVVRRAWGGDRENT